MSELNLYASRIFGEHPLAVWPLDEFSGNESSQYSQQEHPAYLGDVTLANFADGVPLCYGSSGSLRLFPEGEKEIGVSEIRLWAGVLNDDQEWRVN